MNIKQLDLQSTMNMNIQHNEYIVNEYTKYSQYDYIVNKFSKYRYQRETPMTQ